MTELKRKDTLDNEHRDLPNLPYDINLEYYRPRHSEMCPFWKSYRSWFASHGIPLYEIGLAKPSDNLESWLAPPTTICANLPFALRLSGRSDMTYGRTIEVSPQ
ncbi:hypothetical protein C8Q74DRAFT_1263808 [Fomes fomentarius]|nr:hypothetical protein C8Q74DRAFT_1263808 [Fomes fomentarius]